MASIQQCRINNNDTRYPFQSYSLIFYLYINFFKSVTETYTIKILSLTLDMTKSDNFQQKISNKHFGMTFKTIIFSNKKKLTQWINLFKLAYLWRPHLIKQIITRTMLIGCSTWTYMFIFFFLIKSIKDVMSLISYKINAVAFSHFIFLKSFLLHFQIIF